jgi:precorrin-2 dehydrogenase / sirohydrochlorin ferrochelatase
VSGYPILLTGERLHALVVGGGRVAERKALALLESGATVRVVAPEVTASLEAAARREPRLTLVRHAYHSGDIGSAALVIAATNARAVNARVTADAVACGRLVNVADRPEAGNCVTVAAHRAGAVVIGVSAGVVPPVARRIRDAVAERFDARYAAAADAIGRLRSTLLAGNGAGAARWRAAQHELVGPDFCAQVESGAWAARMAEWR